jgi:hypothetical protein
LVNQRGLISLPVCKPFTQPICATTRCSEVMGHLRMGMSTP